MFSVLVFNTKWIVNVAQISDFPIDHRYDDPLVPVETVDSLHFFIIQTGMEIQLMKFSENFLEF